MKYDVIVIGAGHAGCEAACAAAQIGAHTLLVTMDMNKVGQMSCNPAVGGIAKGQIVREIDALGGQMGLVTDATAIQFRMLNRGKGPAVWSPRAQCDREKFILQWRRTLEAQPLLDIWQDQADEIIVEKGRAVGVRTIWGVELRAHSIIVTAGTFLNGLMHIGQRTFPGGRAADPAVPHFTESISQWGIRTGRMKTGTPVRIDKRTVDFSLLEEQPGENDHHQFSYFGPHRQLPQLPCWTLATNEAVHRILQEDIERSPMYNGQIQSTGPRYCPSIESKLVTFPGRDHHPLFLEPEGVDTQEMYLNGFSSSMPMETQLKAMREIPALRNAKAYRAGYAIEYDYFDPTQLQHTLESRVLPGLYLAGQVNGTTGYEEAAGQGIVAGINAALSCVSTKTFEMARDESYIGVLIDDLVTKGVDEPYRMFTSRAEYRILLRQDDADARLTEKGHQLGLASTDRLNWWKEKEHHINAIVTYCDKTVVKPSEVNGLLDTLSSPPLQSACHLSELVCRPQLTLQSLATVLTGLKEVMSAPANRHDEIAEAAEIKIKYRGYIERERVAAEKMHRLENIRIRGHFRYEELHELSTEARQKLTIQDPETLAQASRIPGVSPSDINVLLILMGR